MTGYNIQETTIYSNPRVFTNKKGEPILVKPLEPANHDQLVEMYLHFTPRNSFDGLPPISDTECMRWVHTMIDTGINIVAFSFVSGVIGHSVLFPMNRETSEMLVVVEPRHQQLGIGSQLIHCIIQLAYEAGFSKIWLAVSTKNFVAKHLYNKCGFRYLNTGVIDQVEMLLDMTQYHLTAQVKVDEVMNRQVVSIDMNTSCKKAIDIFLNNNTAALPVVNSNHEVIGILSETDLIIEANVHRKVQEVLTRDVITIEQGANLEQVIRLFQSKKIRCIPVIDSSRKLVGILGRKDILAYYSRNYPG